MSNLRLRHIWSKLHQTWSMAELSRRHPGLKLDAPYRLEHDLIWRISQGAVLRIGAHVHLRHHTELKVEGQLIVGQHVHIGPFSIISAMDNIIIGDDCLLAERVSIRDHDHRIPLRDHDHRIPIRDHDHPTAAQPIPYRKTGYTVAPIRLGRNVWVGAGVSILKGVELGDNCIVGAHAVVNRSFPGGSIIAGVPARLLRTL